MGEYDHIDKTDPPRTQAAMRRWRTAPPRSTSQWVRFLARTRGRGSGTAPGVLAGPAVFAAF
jgi:hypothetical protein